MRTVLVLLIPLLTACEGGILSIIDGKDPADIIDSFPRPDDTDDPTIAPGDSAAPGDTASDTDATTHDLVQDPAIRCFDMGGGRFDRIVTAIVPVPERLDWTRVYAPRVLTWRESESCWDDQASWTAGAEGPAGAHPDASPGSTYTLTVTTYGDACDDALPISLAWTAELRTGDPIVYATTGDTEPVCS